MRTLVLLAATAALLAPAAHAQSQPVGWWDNPERRVPERFDPLGDRRWDREDRPLRVERVPEAGLYRLWGLTPLQTQALRRGDVILEAWVRPTRGRPEVVVRVIVRNDGTVWAQGRAGFACCRPDIQRRVDVDTELSRSTRDRFRALASDPLWRQPEHVVVQEGGGAVSSLCVNGTNYDLYLASEGRVLHRRRSCDDAEVGSAGAVLEALLGAVRDGDPRLQAALPQNGNFQRERAWYADFLANGGRLETDTRAPEEPPPPPGDGPAPAEVEAVGLPPPVGAPPLPQPNPPPPSR